MWRKWKRTREKIKMKNAAVVQALVVLAAGPRSGSTMTNL